MKLNLQIEDSLHDTYEKEIGFPKAYSHMKAAIEAFSRVPAGERYILVYGDARKELEKVFQTVVDSPERLVHLTKKMNAVKIEGVEVSFDEVEMARIKTQAAFHGRTTEQFILEMIQEIKDRMLEKV